MRGFTLIELMVVVAIVGILGAIISGAVQQNIEESIHPIETQELKK